jgi:isopenicillin N synthase-like dioxygenase
MYSNHIALSSQGLFAVCNREVSVHLIYQTTHKVSNKFFSLSTHSQLTVILWCIDQL